MPNIGGVANELSKAQDSTALNRWAEEFKVTTACEVMNLLWEIVQICTYLVKRVFKEME